MTTRVLCVRHGQSADNVANVLSSADPGCALTQRGEQQAEELAQRLRAVRIGHVYSSPLRRARETAEVIAGHMGLSVTLLADLREIDLGDLEGATASATQVTDDPTFRGWLSGRGLPHRFRGGERGSSVVARMGAALDRMADSHPGQDVVAVTHSGAMLAALSNLCSQVPPGPLSLPDNCGVLTLVREDTWRCVEWSPASVRADRS